MTTQKNSTPQKTLHLNKQYTTKDTSKDTIHKISATVFLLALRLESKEERLKNSKRKSEAAKVLLRITLSLLLLLLFDLRAAELAVPPRRRSKTLKLMFFGKLLLNIAKSSQVGEAKN